MNVSRLPFECRQKFFQHFFFVKNWEQNFHISFGKERKSIKRKNERNYSNSFYNNTQNEFFVIVNKLSTKQTKKVRNKKGKKLKIKWKNVLFTSLLWIYFLTASTILKPWTFLSFHSFFSLSFILRWFKSGTGLFPLTYNKDWRWIMNRDGCKKKEKFYILNIEMFLQKLLRRSSFSARKQQ
jgi:hypothetical protein